MTARVPAPFRLAAAAALALSLGGCISLLPKSKPAQLYRFGAPAAAAAVRTDPVGVLRARGLFQQESSSDRLLTLTGAKAAYIAQARWVAPAAVLFDEAVANAFDSAAGRVRLVSRGEGLPSDYALRLDVRNFETHYDNGRSPSVLIRVRAVLTREQNRAQVAEQIFEARVPAGENRVTAIVAAYDKALAQVLNAVVAWTNSSLA